MKKRAVVPKSLIDGIMAQSYMTHDLYGSYVDAEKLYQIVSHPLIYGSRIRADRIGKWSTNPAEGQHADSGLVLIVTDDTCELFAGGQPVICDVYDEGEYHSRHRSLKISQKQAGKKVLMIGLGSIGSNSAREFAKHGIETYMVDPDHIEVSNPYRLGVCDPLQFMVGRNKCLFLEEKIRASIPGAKIHSYPLDICLESSFFAQVIEQIKPDLIYESTDTRDSHATATWFSRHYRIPLLNVALSDGAESGQIFFTDGRPESPCLMCLHPDAGSDIRQTRRQYAEEESAAQKAVPSLSVDTALIAAIGTKVALAYLAGEDIKRYFTQAGNTGDVMWISTSPATWVLDDFAQKLVAKVIKGENCPGCWEPSMAQLQKKQATQKKEE